MSRKMRCYPCSVCDKPVTRRHKSILCDLCQQICHFTCQNTLTLDAYNTRQNDEFNWLCPSCEAKNTTMSTINIDVHDEPTGQDQNMTIKSTCNTTLPDHSSDQPHNSITIPAFEIAPDDSTDQLQNSIPRRPPAFEIAPDESAVQAQHSTRMSLELGQISMNANPGLPNLESTLLEFGLRDGTAEPAPAARPVLPLHPDSEDSELIDDPPPLPTQEPVVHEESSFEDTLPIADVSIPDQPDFVLVNGGTQRGKPLLVERGRFSYTVRETKRGVTYWRCSKRSCVATVRQDSDEFIHLKNNHTHPAEENLLATAKIVADVKTAGLKDVFRSSSAIVTQRLSQEEVQVNLKAPGLLQRVVNRTREKQRPKHPKTLDFELQEDAIPEGFFRHDLQVDGRRHLVFASQRQLDLLGRGKTWYVDGTFSCVRSPFVQLFSVHCFVRSGNYTKQLPLLFVLMSGRRQSDYSEVLRKIKNLFSIDIKLKKIVLDFELAMWKACREVFPDIQLSGCYFHWTQAIWRKVQELGLARAYINDRGTNKLIRKLMCLPLLPQEHINDQFAALKEIAGDGSVRKVFKYVKKTWFRETTWDVDAWCVHKQPIRTNNDCEGWHNRLNKHLTKTSNLNMYELIRALHQEADTVQLQARLVSDRKLKKRQKVSHTKYQTKVFELWDREDLSPTELLRQLSDLVRAPDFL